MSKTASIPLCGAHPRQAKKRFFGELRVTTDNRLWHLMAGTIACPALRKYPDLKVDLMLEERVLDLPMREPMWPSA